MAFVCAVLPCTLRLACCAYCYVQFESWVARTPVTDGSAAAQHVLNATTELEQVLCLWILLVS